MVILDEPMVGIDPEGVMEMQSLIVRLAREQNRAVMLTSHLLHQVQQTCDRMAIFVKGRVIAEGTASELAAMLSGRKSAFELVARTDSKTLQTAISDIAEPGAVDIRMMGADRWRVSLPEVDVGRLLAALVAADVDVREIRDLGTALDEIYHRYFAVSEEAWT